MIPELLFSSVDSSPRTQGKAAPNPNPPDANSRFVSKKRQTGAAVIGAACSTVFGNEIPADIALWSVSHMLCHLAAELF